MGLVPGCALGVQLGVSAVVMGILICVVDGRTWLSVAPVAAGLVLALATHALIFCPGAVRRRSCRAGSGSLTRSRRSVLEIQSWSCAGWNGTPRRRRQARLVSLGMSLAWLNRMMEADLAQPGFAD
jgi:hypothetical protein